MAVTVIDNTALRNNANTQLAYELSYEDAIQIAGIVSDTLVELTYEESSNIAALISDFLIEVCYGI